MSRSMGLSLATVLAITLHLGLTLRAEAITLNGFAAMGASETQGTTYSGSWVPYLAVDRGLNFGPGQAYNRAVGGSTSASLLSGGQHTHVANLVQGGQADLAFLSIGGLDVPPVALQIVTGSLNVPAWAHGVVNNITTAIDTVLAQNPAGMVVMSLPDMTLVPGAQSYTGGNPALAQPVIDAVDLVNSLLKQEVLDRGLVFVDVATAMRDFNAAPLVVGGVTINTTTGSSNPTHFFQDSIHPAVIGNGMFANLFLTALNVGYGTHLAEFSDLTLLTKAGLASSYTGETSSIDFASYIYAVPEPGSITLLVVGLVMLGAMRPVRAARLRRIR